MSRAVVTLRTDEDRGIAKTWIGRAPAGTRVEFKAPKRSIDQNSKMWAMLTDVAMQVPWHGLKLTTEDWKLIFLDGLKRELRIVPNLDGDGFVQLGRSSSDLTKEEMANLLELIAAWGTKHSVRFRDESEAA